MIHMGYVVMTPDGPMYFNDVAEARQYCEDGAEPVKLMADEAELAAHEKAQAGEDEL